MRSFATNSSAIRQVTPALTTLVGLAALALAASVQAGSNGMFSGTVKGVWEDGFRLDTGTRTITVDSYDLCGDFTARHVVIGDRVSVTGEFEGGEFDAFSIARGDGSRICT